MKTKRDGDGGLLLCWKIKLLLIRRKAHPYQNCLALVGGFMDKGEDAAHACQREVREEGQSRSTFGENRAIHDRIDSPSVTADDHCPLGVPT